jgi:PBP1b-binding outer membrane lipoprotein LpoB
MENMKTPILILFLAVLTVAGCTTDYGTNNPNNPTYNGNRNNLNSVPNNGIPPGQNSPPSSTMPPNGGVNPVTPP